MNKDVCEPESMQKEKKNNTQKSDLLNNNNQFIYEEVLERFGKLGI
jgi:hypothetical protein